MLKVFVCKVRTLFQVIGLIIAPHYSVPKKCYAFLLLSADSRPDPVLNLHGLSHLILTIALWDRDYYYVHFTSEITLPKVTLSKVEEPGFKPTLSCSRTHLVLGFVSFVFCLLVCQFCVKCFRLIKTWRRTNTTSYMIVLAVEVPSLEKWALATWDRFLPALTCSLCRGKLLPTSHWQQSKAPPSQSCSKPFPGWKEGIIEQRREEK